jgi:hypothetical protein
MATARQSGGRNATTSRGEGNVSTNPARPRRFRRAALASLLGLASVAALATTATAAEVQPQSCLPSCPPVVGSAYGWVSGTGDTWSISASYNSAGGTNTVSNPTTGVFIVTLPKLTAGGGTVNVSGMSDNCNVFEWSASLSGTTIDIRCFDELGDAIDAPFQFSFTTQRQNNFPFAYALVNDAVSATSTPSLAYQFDQGATITVVHPGTGVYTVRIPYAGYGPGGTAKVSGYGSNAWCSVVALVGKTPTERVRVKCLDPDGLKTDSQFTITFQRQSDQLDQKTLVSGYATIYPPVASGPFAPAGNYSTWNSTAGAVTASKVQNGLYFVHFAGLTTLGNAQVTTLTKTANRCRIGDVREDAGPMMTVEVVCSKMTAAPQFVDTPFMVQVTTTS